MGRDYKDLRIWKAAMELVTSVYNLMGEMPNEELYGLTNQIKRSAISVPSNIAEGQSRGNKEFRHFLRITLGSLAELETQIMIASNLNMVEEERTQPIIEDITRLRKQTYSLLKKI